MAKRSAVLFTVPVSFAGISIGDETAKIGFSISRDKMDLEKADSVLCGKRLTGRLIATRNGDDPNQKALPGMQVNHEISGTFDVKGFRVSPKLIASGATFLLGTIDVGQLAHMSKREGVLTVSDVADSSDDESGDGEGGDDPEEATDSEEEAGDDSDSQILLLFNQGMSQQAIASQLGISRRAVRKALGVS